MPILMKNYEIFAKIIVCRKKDQKKQKEQEKKLKRSRQEEQLSRHLNNYCDKIEDKW